jgi:hypothetical protein
MGNQTYQKRQKEMARLQKQKDKAARRIQRKTEKVKGGPPLEEDAMVSKATADLSQYVDWSPALPSKARSAAG